MPSKMRHELLINANALNFITSVGIAPHPPLSPAGRGEGEGPIVKKLNAFVLDSFCS